jgi:transposase-like protein
LCGQTRTMINFEFKSVIELVKAFPTQQVCIEHLEQLRWNGNVVSPFDATSKVYKCAGNKYKCKNTGKYFNVCTATLFDNTKIELPTWFLAIYLITGHKKGISSLQLAKDLSVTQKTAWFMNHRIRNCFGITDPINDGEKMGGGGIVVESDSTVIGGKTKNMNNKKRKEIAEKKRGPHDNKIQVAGYIERSGIIRLDIVPQNESAIDLLKKHVDSNSILMTDNGAGYKYISKDFAAHGIVDHTKSQYCKDGFIHTNTIEGAFSLLDRMITGIYHYVSPKHMQKYLNEFSFRFNSRDIKENKRFALMLSNTEHRLTYKQLIAE